MNLHADPIDLPTLSLQRSLAHRRIVSWKLASLSLSLSVPLSVPYLISAFAISPFPPLSFSGELVPLEDLPPEEAAAVAAEREKWM